MGLVEELAFLKQHTTRPVKIAMTGPHMFARLCWNEHYPDEQALAFDLARIINQEFRLLDEAGCDVIQLDEPILWCRTKDQQWGTDLVNQCFAGIKHARKALHLCQGNYQEDPSQHRGLRIFPSAFENLAPMLERCAVDVFVIAFASLGVNDASVFEKLPDNKTVAVGCIDVQSHEVESLAAVAGTLQRVLEHVPQARVWATPDCGFNHLPRDIVFQKMVAMTQAMKLVDVQACEAKVGNQA